MSWFDDIAGGGLEGAVQRHHRRRLERATVADAAIVAEFLRFVRSGGITDTFPVDARGRRRRCLSHTVLTFGERQVDIAPLSTDLVNSLTRGSDSLSRHRRPPHLDNQPKVRMTFISAENAPQPANWQQAAQLLGSV